MQSSGTLVFNKSAWLSRKVDGLDTLVVSMLMMMPTGSNVAQQWKITEKDRGKLGGTMSRRIQIVWARPSQMNE